MGDARFDSWPWRVTDYSMYLNATIADPEGRGTLSFNRTVHMNSDTMTAIAARADLVFLTLEALCQTADGVTLDSTHSRPTIPELLQFLFPEASPTSGEEASLPTS